MFVLTDSRGPVRDRAPTLGGTPMCRRVTIPNPDTPRSSSHPVATVTRDPGGRDGPGACTVVVVTKEGTAEWPVRIRSPRLVIRPPGDADRTALIRLMTDPVTREYLGGAVDYASRQALELSPLGITWGRWALALAEDDTMIGSITLDYDRGELELSYALLPEWTGLGYAAESCIALLDWARRELEDEVVIAISQTRNKRSVALLRKLGFTVRKGLEEFGTQQLLLERSLREPLPAQETTLQTAEDPPPPTRR